jgi:integrase
MGVYGTGSIFQRGKIWYVSYFDGVNTRMRSTRSTRKADAIKLREKILKQKMTGTLADAKASRITCGELLDDVLAHVKAMGKESTAKVWEWVIEASLRPLFGHLRAATITTERLHEYRASRRGEGKSESTCNRELSILRTAFHLGRKCTPAKVQIVPYFPMSNESANARQGFLTDEQYDKLRDALPEYLKPLFVTAYFTGVRLGELLAWRWDQVDLEQGFVTLRADETKNGHAHAVPILKEIEVYLKKLASERDPAEPLVFVRDGRPIRDFREAWKNACKAAAVPGLKFHDLRRTAVRNMRRAGVPQVVRMRITGHRTDSMERRYNIVDVDDIRSAKELMESRATMRS